MMVPILHIVLSITSDQLKDINMILQNKKNTLTQNNYNSVSPWIITSQQNKATAQIDSLIKTSDRTYLWQSYQNMEQGPQLKSTVNNLLVIATAYATTPYKNYTNIHYKNMTTLEIITQALDLILTSYYRADLTKLSPPLSGTTQNWWDWQIGIPDVLGDIIVLIQDSISQDLMQKFLASSKRFLPNPGFYGNLSGTVCTKQVVSTAGNLVDTARICFLRGILSQNVTELDASFHALDHILDFVNIFDGFYKDYSFIQHTTIVSTASYGNTLFSGLTTLITILEGNSMYHFNQSGFANICEFIIQAETPFMYNGQTMNMVNGRSISRKEQEYMRCNFFLGMIAVLSKYAPTTETQLQMQKIVKHHINKAKPYYDEFGIYQQARTIMFEILNNTTIPATSPEFLHRRYSMDRVVHRRENYAFAISMHSYKIGDYESINGENLHGWYTGDGMEYMYSNYQQQYTDFFATVDPYLLQGTTELTIARRDSEVDGVRKIKMSNATFVGGTDLNGTGVVGMEFYNFNYKLSGFRSWFMFDQSVIVVASYNSTENYRSTILNRQLNSLDQQIFVDGIVIVNDLKSYTCSRVFVEGTGVNDSIGIIFLNPTEIYLKKELRKGDWSDIGTSSGAAQRNFVTGYVQKASALQLQYVIVFGCNHSEFDLVKQSDYKILAHNSSTHVIQHTVNNISYHAANIFNLSENQSVVINGFKMHSNSSVLIKTGENVQISLSDPTQKQTAVNFTVCTYKNKNQTVNVTNAEGSSFVFEYSHEESQWIWCVVGIVIGVVFVIGVIIIIIFKRKKVTVKSKNIKTKNGVKIGTEMFI
ncbi:polysaccharide_lyase 8 family protein [Hexamita inflata]|uniref:Polysaccharide lyase 8 family protein n=1 Tax=Hexamita inflata TaxID=28002 RepID=A0AA86QRG7_9EUKA|nr:polysaccharide lyase 8 family protein [Hexamita inflata]